ncbi:Hypothetical Protein RRSL_03096 [Ralstonia solanacearum UW551]|uniref:Uncharacterized protein n=1 Tax=Ralstonia solanacearum (strain UW551) TaxID=342110 RepID=A0AB33VF19_RALSU|nr:Hypothetical Protein RRSL_03096 [Ralstonia solanacearum UW551]
MASRKYSEPCMGARHRITWRAMTPSIGHATCSMHWRGWVSACPERDARGTLDGYCSIGCRIDRHSVPLSGHARTLGFRDAAETVVEDRVRVAASGLRWTARHYASSDPWADRAGQWRLAGEAEPASQWPRVGSGASCGGYGYETCWMTH